MQLIKTNDGMFGWRLDNHTVWCKDLTELFQVGWNHISKRKDADEIDDFYAEVNLALKYMTKVNHSTAEFGVYGTFLFTITEKAA